MNKKETVDKIMEEYVDFELNQQMVEDMYDGAIECNVPEEIIYPGMKYQLNEFLGVKDETVVNEVGQSFIDYSINDRKMNNEPCSKEHIKKVIAEEIVEDGIDKISEECNSLQPDIKVAIKNSMKKHVEECNK